jgi:16S rRNA processing protein RimM
VAEGQDETMVIGRIAGAFGVRGEIKVELLTDFPDRFDHLEEVLVGPDRAKVRVEGVRPHKGRVLLKLEGVDAPEDVDALRGKDLAVLRTEAVSLPEGHYYLDEVVGCEVFTEGGLSVGSVTDVIRTGSNDVFVVGTGTSAPLIPVIADAIEELDVAGRRVVVRNWVLEAEE